MSIAVGGIAYVDIMFIIYFIAAEEYELLFCKIISHFLAKLGVQSCFF